MALSDPPGSDPSQRPYYLAGTLAALGRYSRNAMTGSFQVVALLGQALAMLVAGGSDGQRVGFHAVLRRVIDIGLLALGLTLQLGFSIGLVVGIVVETSLQWADLLDIAIARATTVLVEQVGPLFVAIMVAARSGAALAADLGSMVAAREIDALRSLGLSPGRLLVAPAILGALIAVPLLNVIMIACILLTFAVYLQFAQISPALLVLSVALNEIEPAAVGTALGKGALFGGLIIAIAVNQGLISQANTRMVGRSVTSALVTMISTVLLLNALLTLLF